MKINPRNLVKLYSPIDDNFCIENIPILSFGIRILSSNLKKFELILNYCETDIRQFHIIIINTDDSNNLDECCEKCKSVKNNRQFFIDLASKTFDYKEKLFLTSDNYCGFKIMLAGTIDYYQSNVKKYINLQQHISIIFDYKCIKIYQSEYEYIKIMYSAKKKTKKYDIPSLNILISKNIKDDLTAIGDIILNIIFNNVKFQETEI